NQLSSSGSFWISSSRIVRISRQVMSPLESVLDADAFFSRRTRCDRERYIVQASRKPVSLSVHDGLKCVELIRLWWTAKNRPHAQQNLLGRLRHILYPIGVTDRRIERAKSNFISRGMPTSGYMS